MTECNVKFYGPVTLTQPLQGEFLLAYDEAITQALIAEATRPLTPIERGRNIFTMYCSGCHGSYGEGMPAVPSLMTDQVRGYSDEQLRTIVANGVVGTTMPAWGAVFKPEDLDGVLELVRQIELLGG
ncbi:MAG: cytochrome c [Chloroflexi bacterium]|nr:cytochrome c [Chloroflexota bacterium]